MVAKSSDTTFDSNKLEYDQQTSSFRRILPQVIAVAVKSLLVLDYGLQLAIITIILPALLGFNKELNPNETVHVTAIEASWLGSISYLSKLLGCVFSGWITEYFGRKKTLFMVNIPFAVSWWLLYSSTTLLQIFIGNTLLGLAVGLLKAPNFAYIGETCETSIRGVLSALDGMSITLGSIVVFTLSNFIEWRQVCLVCFFIPIITMIGVYFKHRFDCTHPVPTIQQKFTALTQKRTIKPAIILFTTYAIAQICGIIHLLPFAIQMMNAYQTSVNPNLGTIVITVFGGCATAILLFIVKLIGKRKIYLFSLAGAFLTHFSLSVYGFYVLPSGITSFENKNAKIDPEKASIFPLLAFAILRFCSTGLISIPLMMFGELFPFNTRSLATGITTAINFIVLFVANKTFVNVESVFSLPGALAVYGIIGAIGWIVAYRIVPETEKRSMHEIEAHFSDNRLGLSDRKILRFSSTGAEEALIVPDEKTKADHDDNVV